MIIQRNNDVHSKTHNGIFNKPKTINSCLKQLEISNPLNSGKEKHSEK